MHRTKLLFRAITRREVFLVKAKGNCLKEKKSLK